MARKNVLKIDKYVEDDDVLVAITSDFPPYKVCALVSQLLNISLVHNEYLSDEKRLFHEGPIDYDLEEEYFNKSRIEFYRYEFVEKEKKIYLVPNAQDITQPSVDNNAKDTLFQNMDFSPKIFYLFPSEKQLNYLMKFDNYEPEEILGIVRILVRAKLFRAVIATQTSKIKNVGPLYFLE